MCFWIFRRQVTFSLLSGRGIVRAKSPVLISLFLLLFVSTLFAAWDKKPEFRWTQTYHYDSRQHNHRLYNNRFSAAFTYRNEQNNALFKLIPFFEMKRNTDKDIWQRKELGIEAGKDILPWLYFGEAIQKVWMRDDYRYYANYERRDYMESVTRVCFSQNLLSTKYLKLKGFILGEYFYDLDDGKGIRNDAVVGMIVPIGKYLETCINWRHIDRIHYYDSDTFEGSLTVVF
jgi:hypothetical protein